MPLYREFAKLDGITARLHDETTILRFRHLLERHDLAVDMLRVVNDLLQAKGFMLRTGTAVDATLISAPTKVRYRGLAKNTAQIVTLFALSNLWMARRQLMGARGRVCADSAEAAPQGSSRARQAPTARLMTSRLLNGDELRRCARCADLP